jgi:hypothetical protein
MERMIRVQSLADRTEILLFCKGAVAGTESPRPTIPTRLRPKPSSVTPASPQSRTQQHLR